MTEIRRVRVALSTLFMIALAAACSPGPSQTAPPATDARSTASPSLETQIARFAPVDLKVDISALPANEAAALGHIIRAAQVMDGIFLQQVWAGNPALLARLAAVEASAAIVAERAPERLVRERDRLQASVTQLLAGRPLDDQRLALEIAVLADKLDISEELVRFRQHLVACRAALASDQPVGKQLGFLAQELGREVNTMGSKANDAVIQQAVIAMKGELEKFREQLENLE